MIAGCIAVIVAMSPLSGHISKGSLFDIGFKGKKGKFAFDAYLKSPEYAADAKVLAFCRLWCIGEPPLAFCPPLFEFLGALR